MPWTDPVDDDVRRARGEAAYDDVHGVAAAAGRAPRSGAGPYLDFLYGEVWTPRRVPHAAATAGWSRSAAAPSSASTPRPPSTSRRRCAAASSRFEELQEVVMHVAVYLGWIVARRLDDLLVDAAATTGSAG